MLMNGKMKQVTYIKWKKIKKLQNSFQIDLV